MATYREIHGKAVKTVTTNPTDTAAEGQIWFNSTDSNFKSVLVSQAWSSGSPITTGREYAAAGIGTQGSNIVAGGYTYSPDTRVTNCEEYNGSGWTAITAINEVKYLAGGAGSVTAGLVFGGSTPPYTGNTEEWNGSSWSEQNNMGTARSLYHGQAGGPNGQTAGLAISGYSSSGNVGNVEEYDGTSWSEVNNVSTARRAGTGFGTQTAGTFATGYSTTNVNTVEEYDGTNWTTGTSTNVAKSSAASSSMSQSSAVLFGGNGPGNQVTTNESWDGTSWTVAPALAVGRAGLNGAGTGTAAIAVSGYTDPPNTAPTDTEEYNVSANIITAAAWSSGATKTTSTTQQEAGTDGPRDAFAIWGGRTVPANTTNLTEEFNGTSWTAGGTLGTAARKREGGGILTAAWCANGEQPSYIDNVEEYDGTSWSEVNNTPGASSLIGGSGPQTAGIACLGQLPGGAYPKATLEYDGTNWTSGGNTSTARTSSSAGQVGPQTAALISGGEPTPIANTEQYDGTSWSEVADLITALGQACDGTFGVQTAAIQCGGKTSPSPGAAVTTSQSWNGTNWSTSPSLGQARKSHSSSGSSTAGITTAGQTTTTPTVLTSSEEYNGETTALNVKTLTQA